MELFVVEKHIAQRLQRRLLIAIPDKEGNVVVTSSKGNHSYRYIPHRIKRFSFETDILPFQVTYYTDNTHILVNSDSTVFFQVVQNLVQMLGVVYCNRYTTSEVQIMSIEV